MKTRLGLSLFVILLLTYSFTSCVNSNLEEPDPYNYDSDLIAIYNSDWGMIPLPNNFLNPVIQQNIVSIPGVPASDEPVIYVTLPIVDEETANHRTALGYTSEYGFTDPQEDSDLTKSLITGMNKLNGFVPNFTVSIPFSKKLDLETLKGYEPETENVEEANFFLIDITDPEKPEAIGPSKYTMLFNMVGSELPPYDLRLRFNPDDGFLPDNFAQGHTYLIVMLGWTDRGVQSLPKDGEQAQPLVSDSPYLMFAQEDFFKEEGLSYVTPEGVLRNSLLHDAADVYSAEGARQITDYGLTIWLKMMEELMPEGAEPITRADAALAFHFSISSNPMPNYFDPLALILFGSPVVPEPADYYRGEIEEDIFVPEFTVAKAKTDATPSFTVELPLAEESLKTSAFRLLEANADGSYFEKEFTVAQSREDEETVVTLTPAAVLKTCTEYVVAVSNTITDTEGLPIADQSYFGLARANTPLVSNISDESKTLSGTEPWWLSPRLDSRLDTLIADVLTNPLKDGIVSQEELDGATKQVNMVLSVLEQHRLKYQKPIEYLVESNFVATRQDLAIMWTFTTDGCAE